MPQMACIRCTVRAMLKRQNRQYTYFNHPSKNTYMMKKLILFSLLSICFLTTNTAQETSKFTTKNSFIEWNFGVAFIASEGIPFPGTSVLWGKTFIAENNLIFEYEAGFAFPTLVTGKIGIGKKFDNTMVTIGIRPFPFHLYTQASFAVGENGYWITSIELNPLHSGIGLFFESRAIINFGYRWSLDWNK
jgi:hypothetical protein